MKKYKYKIGQEVLILQDNLVKNAIIWKRSRIVDQVNSYVVIYIDPDEVITDTYRFEEEIFLNGRQIAAYLARKYNDYLADCGKGLSDKVTPQSYLRWYYNKNRRNKV